MKFDISNKSFETVKAVPKCLDLEWNYKLSGTCLWMSSCGELVLDIPSDSVRANRTGSCCVWKDIVYLEEEDQRWQIEFNSISKLNGFWGVNGNMKV